MQGRLLAKIPAPGGSSFAALASRFHHQPGGAIVGVLAARLITRIHRDVLLHLLRPLTTLLDMCGINQSQMYYETRWEMARVRIPPAKK